VFVVRLDGDPIIMLQSHAPFQEANLIAWFFHDLGGNLKTVANFCKTNSRRPTSKGSST